MGVTIASGPVPASPPSRPALLASVVGIGADGWPSLTEAARERVLAAEVVIGAERQLALLPDVAGQVRRPWPRPLDVQVVAEQAGQRVVVLASGDPTVSGIGSTLVAAFGAKRLEILPAVSSVALARARLGWAAEDVEVVTVVGRRPETVLRHLAPARRLLVLSSDATTPGVLAPLLTAAGYGASVLTVLGDLGADTESRREATAAAWTGDAPALHVLALDLRGPVVGSWATGLPDGAFEHDGQLTKRDLRASALAQLRPQPSQVLWDVGAGAGSVGIEWMRAHPTCRAWAVEHDETRAARIARNARSLGVPDLVVVGGRAPDALARLPRPHAVFVGGGATVPGVLATCRAQLRPGGRLVVHGVTLETEAVLAASYAELGGELTRHAVETAAPIGTFTGWTPARAVTQWSWTKPEENP